MNEHLHTELTDINSFLKDLPKLDVRTQGVPEGYFDSMESNFFNSINPTQQPKSSTPSKNIFSKFNVPMSLAAAVVFAVVGLFVFKQFYAPQDNIQLSDNDIYNYLNENYEEVAPKVEPKEPLASAKKQVIDQTLDSISDEEIKAYLLEEEELGSYNVD